MKTLKQYLKEDVTMDQAVAIGDALCIDWNEVKFSIGDFCQGLQVELEHGIINPETNITNDDLTMTGKIALAHLNEFGNYYSELAKMEDKLKKEND